MGQNAVYAICLINDHGGLGWHLRGSDSWDYRFKKYLLGNTFGVKGASGPSLGVRLFSIQISKGNVIVLRIILALPKGR